MRKTEPLSYIHRNFAKICAVNVVVNLREVGTHVLKVGFAEIIPNKRQSSSGIVARWNDAEALSSKYRAFHRRTVTSGYSTRD